MTVARWPVGAFDVQDMALITVFLLGFVDIFLPVPMIIAMDGPIEPAFVVVGISGMASSLFFVYGSWPIRRWLVRRYGMDSAIFKRTERFMVKYGAAGVGLLAPMILGQALTAAAAVVLGAPTGKLAVWMIAGIWLWTAIYYGAVVLGVSVID